MSKHPRKKSLLDGLLYGINITLALALLVSYLGYYLSPEISVIPALLALGYPFLLLLNLAFVIYWILRFKPKMVLSMICIALGYTHLTRFYQWGSMTKIMEEEESLRALTYNVRSFNKYQWIESSSVPNDIGRLIEREDPHLLLLQEYRSESQTPVFEFPHQHIMKKPNGQSGNLAIYSRFPLRNKGQLYLTEEDSIRGSAVLYADLEWRGSLYRLINLHLASVHLSEENLRRLQNPQEGDSERIKKEFGQIFSRLRQGFKIRAPQARSLAQFIENSPHPVILGGDLNSTPHSYAYHQLSERLEDAYLQAGSGWASTYPRWWLPLRIDHWLYDSSALQAIEYNICKVNYSDHYPLLVEFELR